MPANFFSKKFEKIYRNFRKPLDKMLFIWYNIYIKGRADTPETAEGENIMTSIKVKIDGTEYELIECTGYFPTIGETEEYRRDLFYLAILTQSGEVYEALYSDNFEDGEEYTSEQLNSPSTYDDDLDTIEVDGKIGGQHDYVVPNRE